MSADTMTTKTRQYGCYPYGWWNRNIKTRVTLTWVWTVMAHYGQDAYRTGSGEDCHEIQVHVARRRDSGSRSVGSFGDRTSPDAGAERSRGGPPRSRIAVHQQRSQASSQQAGRAAHHARAAPV